MKARLVTSPVFALPSRSGGFIVYSDACGTGLGCVLIHHGKMIAYASRQLKDHERNYPTQLGDGCSSVYTEDLAALFVWRAV